jgi:hypothetical protein
VEVGIERECDAPDVTLPVEAHLFHVGVRRTLVMRFFRFLRRLAFLRG